MAIDVDDGIAWVFKWTLPLWLFPYIFWFFGKKIAAGVYNWVTEPVPVGERQE